MPKKKKKSPNKEKNVADNIKIEPAKETEVSVESNNCMPNQEWEVEFTDKIVCVKKKQIQLKEEQSPMEIKSGSIFDEVFEDDEVPAKRKRLSDSSTDQDADSSSSDQSWEFTETNGAMQVRRKRPKPQVQMKNEPVENTSFHENSQSPPRQATSLVHFELLQDDMSFRSTKTIHQVQSVAEKIILNVKVLQDLQLIGVELSARTEKLSKKYKKSRLEFEK